MSKRNALVPMQLMRGIIVGLFFLNLTTGFLSYAEKPSSGFLTLHGKKLFPIGCYELPREESDLRAIAEAGFNLVHCANGTDLDRAQSVGIMGWLRSRWIQVRARRFKRPWKL